MSAIVGKSIHNYPRLEYIEVLLPIGLTAIHGTRASR